MCPRNRILPYTYICHNLSYVYLGLRNYLTEAYHVDLEATRLPLLASVNGVLWIYPLTSDVEIDSGKMHVKN